MKCQRTLKKENSKPYTYLDSTCGNLKQPAPAWVERKFLAATSSVSASAKTDFSLHLTLNYRWDARISYRSENVIAGVGRAVARRCTVDGEHAGGVAFLLELRRRWLGSVRDVLLSWGEKRSKKLNTVRVLPENCLFLWSNKCRSGFLLFGWMMIKIQKFCVSRKENSKAWMRKAKKREKTQKIITCEFCEWFDDGWWLLRRDNWRRITPGLWRSSLIILPLLLTLCDEIEDGIWPIEVDDVM